jgi:hypothetical protein
VDLLTTHNETRWAVRTLGAYHDRNLPFVYWRADRWFRTCHALRRRPRADRPCHVEQLHGLRGAFAATIRRSILLRRAIVAAEATARQFELTALANRRIFNEALEAARNPDGALATRLMDLIVSSSSTLSRGPPLETHRIAPSPNECRGWFRQGALRTASATMTNAPFLIGARIRTASRVWRKRYSRWCASRFHKINFTSKSIAVALNCILTTGTRRYCTPPLAREAIVRPAHGSCWTAARRAEKHAAALYGTPQEGKIIRLKVSASPASRSAFA